MMEILEISPWANCVQQSHLIIPMLDSNFLKSESCLASFVCERYMSGDHGLYGEPFWGSLLAC